MRSPTPQLVVRVLLFAGLGGLVACGTGTWVRPQTMVRCDGCRATGDELDHRVILLGDAGYAGDETPTLPALEALAAMQPSRTTVVYLGDNIYPAGLPVADEEHEDGERRRAETVLDHLIAPVRGAGAEGIFVPGNHDWDRGGALGAPRVAEQARYVAAAAPSGRIRLLPPRRCPGPTVVDRGSRLRMVLVDTEWLLGDYPGQGREDCPVGPEAAPRTVETMDEERFWAELAAALQAPPGRHVLLAAHHPPRTRGPHGGYFTLVQALFPFIELDDRIFLPIPMLYPLGRYVLVPNAQDLVSDVYGEMADRMVRMARESGATPLLIASGHEHSLQVLEDRELGPELLYLVSGGGSEADPVGRNRQTLYKAAQMGLMVVDYYRDGRVWLEVVETPEEGPRRVGFSLWVDEGDRAPGAVRPAPARARR